MAALAQPGKPLVLETRNAALVLNVGARGRVYQSYFGEKLVSYSELDTGTKEAYVAAGTDNVFEPAIRVVHADGNPALDLQYVSHTLQTGKNVSMLRVVCRDSLYPVSVTMVLTAYAKENVFKSAVEIQHAENAPLVLASVASAMLRLNADSYWLTHLHGDWAEEMRLEETQLTSGLKLVDSKSGTRAAMFQAPLFLLALNQPAAEYSGEVIAGTLAWSGNFRFAFEVENDHCLRVGAGINPYASDYRLPPNQPFTAPEFIFTYSHEGTAVSSANLQQWARKYGIHRGEESRAVVLNNWETTKFNFTEAKLTSLMAQGGRLGADLFLLDDAWFGNKFPRNNAKAGLGDWQVNKAKLPGGLQLLVAESKKNKLQFGLWIEPEMVNPQSELYTRHPEWILRLPGRPDELRRNQLVLDLANPQVQDFAFGIIDSLLIKHPGIAYFKWDSNREITSPYSQYLGPNQSNLSIDYVRGLYGVMARVQQKYPRLPMMLCSSGGGRIDYGALKYFTEFWPSDNTDPVERIYLHYGYSFFYPSLALSSHVTSWGKQPLKFRTDVAMLGKLGYDIDLGELSAPDFAFSQAAVKTYKALSPTIWRGTQYRLVSPYATQGSRAAFQYAAADKSEAIVFSYTMHPRFRENFTNVKLQGLAADKQYVVREINLYPGTQSKFKFHGKAYSGEYLMKVGMPISSQEPLTSAIFQVKRQ